MSKFKMVERRMVQFYKIGIDGFIMTKGIWSFFCFRVNFKSEWTLCIYMFVIIFWMIPWYIYSKEKRSFWSFIKMQKLAPILKWFSSQIPPLNTLALVIKDHFQIQSNPIVYDQVLHFSFLNILFYSIHRNMDVKWIEIRVSCQL